MIVVMVLMISCHVSTLRIKECVGAHTTTSNTHTVKNIARLATFDDTPANRSKGPTRDDTSLGIKTGSWRFPIGLLSLLDDARDHVDDDRKNYCAEEVRQQRVFED